MSVLTLLLLLAAPSLLRAGTAIPKNVLFATTTSTQDSGLLDALGPSFAAKSGYALKTIAPMPFPFLFLTTASYSVLVDGGGEALL